MLKASKLRKFKEELAEYIDVFNEVYEKRYKPSLNYINNFVKARETYSLEEILEAVRKAPEVFWTKDPSPALFLRTANKNGGCDYIGDILNAPEKEDYWEMVSKKEGIDIQ